MLVMFVWCKYTTSPITLLLFSCWYIKIGVKCSFLCFSFFLFGGYAAFMFCVFFFVYVHWQTYRSMFFVYRHNKRSRDARVDYADIS